MEGTLLAVVALRCFLSSTINNPIHSVILGAGPYGLSLAAHLREAGVPFRIFGRSMQSWKTQMPAGMKLKSDGFASNLSAGSQTSFTLEDFCREHHLPYHPTHLPVAVEHFSAYGDEFAHRFVPTLEEKNVTALTREGDHFRLTLDSGETVLAANVIVATGVSLFQYTPREYAHLPAEMVTHTADHHTFDRFAGQDVVVLGRGASSLNAAVLLYEAGAHPTLITRKPNITLHGLDDPHRPLWHRLRHPSSPLGTSMRSWLTSTFPGVFRALPAWLRRGLVYKHLEPAGGSALIGRMGEQFPLLRGWHVTSSELVPATVDAPRRIRLQLKSLTGETRELLTDHLIAGTGFHADLTRMSFLSEQLRHDVRLDKGGPRLRPSFESSVPGLYFAGPVSAASFGPLLKFAAGSHYAALRVTRSLKKKTATSAVISHRFAATPKSTNA